MIAQIEQQKDTQFDDFIIVEMLPQLGIIGLVDGVGVGPDQIDMAQDRLLLGG